MRIYKAKDYADMSRKAANIVSAQVIMKPNCVLGLATGSTPIGLYKQLVEWFRKGDLDFSEVMTVNLDEYKGLSRENDQSYYYFMHQNLFDHVNIPVENTHLPNGMEPDSEKECRRYTELIQSLGGVDLQLLGIGHNGHIGFNEPGESFDKQVHCVNLTESTIEANIGGGCPEAGIHHGDQDHYAGEENIDRSQRRRQGGDRTESFLRPHYTAGAGIGITAS